MRPKQLKKIFELVKKTGDRVIFADSMSDQIFVVMNFDDYELLVDYEDDYIEDDFDSDCDEFECDDFDANEFQKEISDLTEQEMLQKINNDIGLWRDAQKKKEDELAEEILNENNEIIVNKSEKEPVSQKSEQLNESSNANRSTPVFSSLGEVLTNEKYLNREFDNSPRIKTVEEEDLSDVEHVEEKFYLEPVE